MQHDDDDWDWGNWGGEEGQQGREGAGGCAGNGQHGDDVGAAELSQQGGKKENQAVEEQHCRTGAVEMIGGWAHNNGGDYRWLCDVRA
uniref:Uncharacterized protein n=1 Tax=Globodera rostochiensis TaxID=31243 RepID=A0A914HIQ3_GLORO